MFLRARNNRERKSREVLQIKNFSKDSNFLETLRAKLKKILVITPIFPSNHPVWENIQEISKKFYLLF